MKKQFTKILSVVLAILILCTAIPFTASAADESFTEGYYTYTVTDDKATITKVDTAINGDIIIPETLGGYPVVGFSVSGFGVFYGCKNVTSIHLPKTIQFVHNAFYWVPNLKYITVDESNPFLSSMDGVLYNNNMTKLLVYPCNKEYSDFVVPASVKRIEGFQYSGCSRIKTLSFEKGSQLEFFNGDGLFYFSDIDELILPNSCSINNMQLGSSCRVKSLKFENGREEEYFTNNMNFGGPSSTLGNLTQIDLIESFIGIAEKGLYNYSLTTVIIRNPNCDIYDKADTINESATIYGYANSTAHVYAQKYNRTFVALECNHSYTSVQTNPTCVEQGYTTYTCECGDSYVADYVDANGHTYSAVVTAPTCTAQGYTTYTCECGDSYVTDYVDATDHNDTDGDNICDGCGEELYEDNDDTNNCSHMCHKSGIIGFFWKIINFLQKLFGTNKYCSCGAAHY